MTKVYNHNTNKKLYLLMKQESNAGVLGKLETNSQTSYVVKFFLSTFVASIKLN